MKEQNEIIENEKQEVIETDTAEGSATVEKVEENMETTEESTEDTVAASSETLDETEVETQIENMKKNDAAKMLVQKAKIIVKESEDQLDECKLLLESDLNNYQKAKQELKDNGMDECELLLRQLGYESEGNSDLKEDTVVFEPKAEVAPIRISDVSSGKFSSFLVALITAIVTLAGMAFFASEKLGITVNIANLADPLERAPIAKFYGKLIGLPGDATIGSTFMVLVALLIMFIIYKIRVSRRANKNLRVATEQLAEAEEYTEQKSSCKDQMDKVDAYIHEAIETLKTYEVILNEQKGKLERILHIEHDKIETSDFHHKSNIEMKDTEELINGIKDFMSVPMSEEGKLSGKSSLYLHRAKSRIQKVLDRLY